MVILVKGGYFCVQVLKCPRCPHVHSIYPERYTVFVRDIFLREHNLCENSVHQVSTSAQHCHSLPYSFHALIFTENTFFMYTGK